MKADIDEVVIKRILGGQNTPANKDERSEVMCRWLAAGRPLNQLYEITGWNISRLKKENS